MNKIIFYLFAILLFFVPLVLWPYTSEVFEFNKIVVIYILTTLIVSVWVMRMIIEGKVIFRRTILDLPLLIFLVSQLISTILSIDPMTSWLGYYSRFNGGFLSLVCYGFLYWAFVSNMDARDTLLAIRYSLFSAVVVLVYGVLEHFGIDKDVWVQDVQSRVFSTLGQPNWLASWLVALMPLTWAIAANSKQMQDTKYKILSSIPYVLSALFFTTLLFTKSRSGFLGLVVADTLFWLILFLKYKASFLKEFVICHLSFVILALAIGTQWTPSLRKVLRQQSTVNSQQLTAASAGPALEVGGTESGIIRRIVWKGAVEIWKHYPVFGTGVETFAFSYYKFRPIEHNLVSEWDFVYNKAHNEYLNIAANTGTFGLLSYLILVVFSIIQILNLKHEARNTKQSQNSKGIKILEFENYNLFEISNLKFGILAGYTSLLVTNFLGFSVVPTQLQFFLFPAIAVGLVSSDQPLVNSKNKKLDNSQKVLCIFPLIATYYLLITITKYWYADTQYAKGHELNTGKRADMSQIYLKKATDLEPNQAIYHNDLASAYTSLAVSYNQQKDSKRATEFAGLATAESQKAADLSPANVNMKRVRFGMYVMLSAINPGYVALAGQTLIDAINRAPTDAKLYYNLGLYYIQTGQPDLANETLQKTIELKANYRDARLAYAVFLINRRETRAAKDQLAYILKYIDPNDPITKQTLESVK